MWDLCTRKQISTLMYMSVKIGQKTERRDKSVEKQSSGLKVPTARLNELNNGMDKKCAAGIVKFAHACTLLVLC